MNKRSEDRSNDDFAVPSKRAKLDNNAQRDSRGKKLGARKSTITDDIWGEDFGEKDFEEMDLIASQVCSQESDIKVISEILPSTNHMQNFNLPSCSKYHRQTSTPLEITDQAGVRRNNLCNEKVKEQKDQEYKSFENNLLNRRSHNSSVLLQTEIVLSDSTSSEQLEKLKKENEKLLNDFITKEGEIAFLRHQLHQVQIRTENEKLEKARFIEEQADRHRSEINTVYKQNEKLKTQLDLQKLEVTNLVEKYKILESGSVSLTEPHMIDSNSSVRSNRTINRAPPVKAAKIVEKSLQTDHIGKPVEYLLKAPRTYYPFATLPKLIFEMSLPEKPIVSVQISEKVGNRDLPILQEENSVKIFENPEIIRPAVTIIDGKELSVQFFLPEFAILKQKTKLEINSENCIATVNKLVSTTRELMLNNVAILQMIYHKMKNDNIRDMDDLYFSDLYKITCCAKSLYDAKSWYKEERGIEARRALGILAYVAKESDYLSNYIAGKTTLLTQADNHYKVYSQQMTRYNSWSKKGCDFEMMEICLELSTSIGLVRRAHQFSGLIIVLAKILCNVQKKVGFCTKGLKYISEIFRELVFSRPLPFCCVSLIEIMMTFMEYPAYLRSICSNSKTTAIVNWKNALYFTPDACTLQILMAQMENISWDEMSIISIAFAAMQSVKVALQRNNTLLKTDGSKSCNCLTKLVAFVIKMLCNCIKVNIRKMKPIEMEDDPSYWENMKKKQLITLREGIEFLYILATRDPDIIIRLSDIEDSFYFIMHNIHSFENLTLRECNQEALTFIRSTFIIDRILQTDIPNQEKYDENIKADFVKKRMILPANYKEHFSTNARDMNNVRETISKFQVLFNRRVN